MKYRFQCSSQSCGATTELVQPIDKPLPDRIDCQFCGAPATLAVEAPAVARSGMSDRPIDVAVGRDAEIRWKEIGERQAERDRVRAASGRTGLEGRAYREFAPLGEERRAARAKAMAAAGRDGFRPAYDSAEEAALVARPGPGP